ncbi:MAG: hypothetical protein AB7V58_12415 [Solirubrobacterales bacterium]
MAEAEEKEEVKGSASVTDAAIVQIREVVKWLIAAFAAVGALLAAGSQLSEIGHLTGWRLVAAGGGIFLVLVGIALAILKAVRVLTPAPVSLKELAEGKDHEEVREKIGADPSLLLGQGDSVGALRSRQQELLQKETDAWGAFGRDEDDSKALRSAERASADRVAADEAVRWLIQFARYTEIAALFRHSLRWMTAGAAVAAIGIGLFAWAAHPEDKEEDAAPVVAKAPAAIEIDLSEAGTEALGEKLGARCGPHAVPAVALGGEADALEVVTVPSPTCALARFTLTGSLGTYASTEPATE